VWLRTRGNHHYGQVHYRDCDANKTATPANATKLGAANVAITTTTTATTTMGKEPKAKGFNVAPPVIDDTTTDHLADHRGHL